MPSKERIPVYSENYTKTIYINTLCGQNAGLLKVKVGSTCSKYYGLKWLTKKQQKRRKKCLSNISLIFHVGLPSCNTVRTCRLKMEAVCSSRTLISTYKSIWCYYPEYQHGQLHRRDNLKLSYNIAVIKTHFVNCCYVWLKFNGFSVCSQHNLT
jgi:hypothetical protein